MIAIDHSDQTCFAVFRDNFYQIVLLEHNSSIVKDKVGRRETPEGASRLPVR